MTPELLPLQQNLDLKRLFANRGLDLAAVIDFTPHDLDLENRRLLNLAKFVYEYDQYGSREAMEAVKGTFLFPPIFPDISPDNDWYRFELWLQGEAIQKPLADMLPDQLPFRKPEEIGDNEIEAESKRLLDAIEAANIGIGLCKGLPPRLLYAYLHETLGETFEVSNGGCVIDGCSGYCPDCIQRPWCDTGQDSCWSEDVEAGKIHFTEALTPYVSAAPHSLGPLQKIKAERDAEMEKFMRENPIPEPDEDWLATQN